jgi:MFS family permease
MHEEISMKKAETLGPKFIRLWQASAMSNLADGVWLTAGPLLAVTLTRDPLLVAGLVTAQRLPWFLFSLHSGVIVDRFDRKRILWISNAIRTALIAGLALFVLSGQINIYGMYVFFFLLGSVEPFFDNASFAILPRVVSQTQLEKANGRLFAASTISNEFVGPPIGSFLFAIFPPLAFVMSALSYGTSSALMGSLPGEYRKRRPTTARILEDIREGFRWFLGNGIIRSLALLSTLQNVVATAGLSLLVLYAQDHLGLDAVGYGVLISAGAVGGVAAGMISERVARRIGTGMGVVAGCVIMSIAFLVLGTTQNSWIAMAMLACTSFAFVLTYSLVLALRQTLIPDDLLGRVTSVYRFLAIGAAPLSGLLGGFLARQWGLQAPFIFGGVVTFLATMIIYPRISNAAVDKAKAQSLSKK